MNIIGRKAIIQYACVDAKRGIKLILKLENKAMLVLNSTRSREKMWIYRYCIKMPATNVHILAQRHETFENCAN